MQNEWPVYRVLSVRPRWRWNQPAEEALVLLLHRKQGDAEARTAGPFNNLDQVLSGALWVGKEPR